MNTTFLTASLIILMLGLVVTGFYLIFNFDFVIVMIFLTISLSSLIVGLFMEEDDAE